MCGIIGSTNKELVQMGLDELRARGRDNAEIQGNSTYWFGHALHAIVGRLSQPIFHEGVLVSNCEIYNWEELAKKHNIKARNDADLLAQLLDRQSVSTVLEQLDGVYAFIYKKDNMIIATRDILGVKPLYYTDSGTFASENKALDFRGKELDPRQIAYYDLSTKKMHFQEKNFFTLRIKEGNEDNLVEQFTDLFTHAVTKRIPDTHIKVGIMLSGGVDSTMIAYLCKKLGYDATCYTAALDNPMGEDPHDLTASIEVAHRYGFEHKIIRAAPDEVPLLARRVAKQIESSDAVKVAVGIPFFLCAKEAVKDNCKVLFSGLGAEEIMAGYQRHKESDNINDECLAGLLKLHERDLYRDDIITIRQGIELRLPFLDKALVEFSLTVPANLKITDEYQKYLLRQSALKIGMDKVDAYRPKKAAQYGSRFDRALKKSAKAHGYATRREFIEFLVKER